MPRKASLPKHILNRITLEDLKPTTPSTQRTRELKTKINSFEESRNQRLLLSNTNFHRNKMVQFAKMPLSDAKMKTQADGFYGGADMR